MSWRVATTAFQTLDSRATQDILLQTHRPTCAQNKYMNAGMRPFSVCTLLIVHEHAYFIKRFRSSKRNGHSTLPTQTRHQCFPITMLHGTLTQALADTSEHVFGRRATDVHARFSLGAICRPYTHTCSHGHAPSSSFLLHVSMLNMPLRTSARPHAACTSSFAFHSPSVTVPSALVYLPGPSRTPWTKLPSYVSPVSR